MSTFVSPTTTDVSRAISRLNDRVRGETGENMIELLAHVSDNLAYKLEHAVNLRKITRRDIGVAMAAHGANSRAIEYYAGTIARTIRADYRFGRSGAIL